MKYFVVGDVHGCYDSLVALLEHWNPKTEQLILLGDLVDRGRKSLDVLHLAMRLKEEHGAIILGGNHEDLFLDWLNEPEDEGFYYDLGGRETIDSFFENNLTFQRSPEQLAKLIKEGFPDVVAFLKERPSFYETSHYIFVHAGIDFNFSDWKNASDSTFKWIRERFIYGKNETGKTIIFGHTPTHLLNQDKSDGVWISPCGTKIGIDGGCVFGGKLHGISIHNDERHMYSVSKKDSF